MSLGAVYVRATDGEWYTDPVIKGERCHIIFDEDDPPEFVMHTSDSKEAIGMFESLCKSNGLKTCGREKVNFGSRTINGKSDVACSLFFRLLSRIPPPSNRQPKKNKGEGTYIDPENAT